MYAGLTTADKGALLDAKARGAEWVARDEDEELVGFRRKPKRYIDMESTSDHWERTESENYFIAMPNDEPLQFIQWSDAEPVNIDLALAQIAEMESAQKLVQEYLASDVKSKAPMTNRDKWMQLWNESDEILARQFVQQEWYGTQWCVYMFSEEPISRHDKWEDAIQAAITALHSPYTEGATK